MTVPIINGIRIAAQNTTKMCKAPFRIIIKPEELRQTRLKFKPFTGDYVKIENIGQKLDLESTAAKFFGIKNSHTVWLSDKQPILTLLKNHDCNIDNLFEKVRMRIDLRDPSCVLKAKEYLYSQGGYEKLLEKGAGRWTFCDSSLFKADELHTIGFVYDKQHKRLFVLDSISQNIPNLTKKEINDIMRGKEIITEIFDPNRNCNYSFCNKGFTPKIIFSDKYQQSLSEYTCNNWTHANIDAVQNALKNGADIHCPEQLNAVLPDDINKILTEQMEYVNTNGHKIYDIILSKFGI